MGIVVWSAWGSPNFAGLRSFSVLLCCMWVWRCGGSLVAVRSYCLFGLDWRFLWSYLTWLVVLFLQAKVNSLNGTMWKLKATHRKSWELPFISCSGKSLSCCFCTVKVDDIPCLLNCSLAAGLKVTEQCQSDSRNTTIAWCEKADIAPIIWGDYLWSPACPFNSPPRGQSSFTGCLVVQRVGDRAHHTIPYTVWSGKLLVGL